nr:MAG: wsv267-like protein [Penaeus semisulcatus pemonivirus]
MAEAVKRANLAKLVLSTIPSSIHYQKTYMEAQIHLENIQKELSMQSPNCHGLIVLIYLSPEDSLNIIERFRYNIHKNGKREHTNEVTYNNTLNEQASLTAHANIPKAIDEKMRTLCPLCCPYTSCRVSARSQSDAIVTRHVWLGSQLSARQQGRYRNYSHFIPTSNGPIIYWPNYESNPAQKSHLCCLLNTINHWGINDSARLSSIWSSAGRNVYIDDITFFPDCARLTGRPIHRVVDPSRGGKYDVALLIRL